MWIFPKFTQKKGSELDKKKSNLDKKRSDLFREIYRSIPILSFSLDSFPIEMYRCRSWINENEQKLYFPLPFY
ncbi:hypothetical protein MIMGU_mgv1a024699mg, partial [Erythranthe guttata]